MSSPENLEISIAKLIRKRGSLKGKLTSFTNFIQTLLTPDSQGTTSTAGEPAVPKQFVKLSEVDRLQLEARLTPFELLLSQLDAIHAEIVEIEDEANLQMRYDEYAEFEIQYFRIIALARELLFQNQPQPPGSRSSSNSQHSGPTVHSHVTTNSQNNVAGTSTRLDRTSSLVKLPTLQMKIYNGDPEQFLSFYEGFKSLVHNNNSFDDVTRFLYLKSVLGPEPSKIIESLDIIPANYHIALSLIEKRYKNDKFLIHSHIKGVIEFPKITKESAVSLRQLSDSLQAHLRALESLGEPVNAWSSLIQYIITDKLDYNSKKEWEIETLKSDNTPETSVLIDFLEKRARLLEKIERHSKPSNCSQPSHFSSKSKPFNSREHSTSLSHVTSKLNQPTHNICVICKSDHRLIHCPTFIDMPANSRFAEVKKHNLCLNCLRGGHFIANCKSGNCKKCNKKHSTLLHDSQSQGAVNTANNSQQDLSSNTGCVVQTQGTTVSCASLTTQTIKYTNRVQLLPTAIIYVYDSKGNRHECVALLDCASMRSYMTISLCTKLKLHTTQVHIPISGIGKSQAKVSAVATTKIESIHSDFSEDLTFLLMQHITQDFPPSCVDPRSIQMPDNIKLANPHFSQATKIDILLGLDIFWRLFPPAQPLIEKYPYLQNSHFGYIVSGQFNQSKSTDSTFCHFSTVDLSRQLAQFWEIENISVPKPLSTEENACEAHFAKTVKRDPSGKFIVSIPLSSAPSSLGKSEENAKRQFLSLEKRLQSNKKLKTMYVDFMTEYETLGHMRKINTDQNALFQYFIPHHGVYKEQSITTKLRVVFNSSCPTSNGISLNDIQLNGPVLQSDLFSILLRLRRFKVVITSDCAKMYRSVILDPEQRSLQRIFWRNDPSQPLQIYELCTVTYGEKSSSFLAIRCLFELAKGCERDHPEISKIIRNDMYCDDLITSCESLEKARYICYTIRQVLESGGFTLHKWNSNFPEVLNPVQAENIPNNILEFGANQSTRTLGLLYSSYSDSFFFKIVDFEKSHKIASKRTVLSYISMIFDPLGTLNPCTITAKIFMQKLWLLKNGWDEPIGDDLESQWYQYCKDLSYLNELHIPRQSICTSAKSIEIHAFSDSSKSAYGTCLYLRSVDANDHVSVHLLCSKTKVAPLKTLTVPKLELCGAVMMAQLVKRVKEILDIRIHHVFYWVDSKIILSWIKTQPHLLDTYISNRVVQIQAISDEASWNYVPTDQNPADLVTRGVNPQKLIDLSLWWHGPIFLSESCPTLPSQHSSAIHEATADTSSAPIVSSFVSVQPFESCIQFDRFSSAKRLNRTAAYCLRFTKNCRSSKGDRITGPLTVGELQASLKLLVRASQQESYQTEIQILNQNKPLPKKNNLIKLNPFLDVTDQTLRVGGRLANSNFNHDKKHPLILSSKHSLSKLLLREEHERLCHVGPQQMLSSIRERYWIINARNLAKRIAFECIVCFKCRPKDLQNLLGNLPSTRVIPQSPFSVVGTDFCGPFQVKNKMGRGWKPIKCYVCLFVCFSTRAIHLEPVTDMTTEAFVLCFRRFASRRGTPIKVYSDNGRNYCGAKSQLKELGEFLSDNSDNLTELFAREHFSWSLLPPYSPSMGGLWEAGVKSSKFHLKRVIGNAILSFEHFTSVLCQVEGILNSRPLSPLSSHPEDLLPLTPAHFLIGRAITTLPDPDVSHIQENKLSLYQRIQQITQNFWSRWSKEYISELQVRSKWQTTKHNVAVGTLVLIKDDNLPPNKWRLGRVIEVCKGPDNLVRVVKVRSQNGDTSRAISRICPLPNQTNDFAINI